MTNVDPEHLDHWGTPEAMIAGYDQFVANVPFYGFAVMCTDHPVVQQLVGRIEDRRIITYGENPQADVRLSNLDHSAGRSRFSVVFRDRSGVDIHGIADVNAPIGLIEIAVEAATGDIVRCEGEGHYLDVRHDEDIIRFCVSP